VFDDCLHLLCFEAELSVNDRIPLVATNMCPVSCVFSSNFLSLIVFVEKLHQCKLHSTCAAYSPDLDDDQQKIYSFVMVDTTEMK